MTAKSIEEAFARVWAIADALNLPELVRSTTHGTPSLKVRTTFLASLKDRNIFVIHCPQEEKPLLLESAPHIYFETDHYKGWPYLPLRLDAISDEELAHRIKLAWLARAPAKLRKMLDGNSS